MSIQILTGDCRSTLATLPEKSVQACITSPPYFGLRDYKVAGQIGLEPTPAEYVAEMVAVFAAVRRVLKDDGVLFLNLGDSYAANRSYQVTDNKHVDVGNNAGAKVPLGLKPKDLIGIPWRVAFALQQDGWYLRAACPWIKRNGMPDSVQDRPTQCIETVFMLTKSKTCYYDAEAVKVAAKEVSVKRRGRQDLREKDGWSEAYHGNPPNGIASSPASATRLRRTSDWFFESWQGLLLDSDDEPSAFVVNLKGYKEAHFATFPPKLVEPCVLAATSGKGECPTCGKAWERVRTNTPMVIDRSERTHEMGRTRSSGTMVSPETTETTGWRAQCTCGHTAVPQTVLDPFGGAGTTGLVAQQFGRNAILCELNPEYVKLTEQRLGLTTQSEGRCLD